MNNKVDLIIPTYNRPNFLRRILGYYDSYSVNFNIIIADSSANNNKKLNKKIVSYFPNLKIQYIDKYNQNLASHLKFAEMIKHVVSKYCVFCPDDDFIVPDGINKAVDFLEKNPDYSAAHGTYISFYLYKSLLGSKDFWWRFIYPFQSIESSNPTERLKLHLTNYYQVLWAVRRTTVVKQAYKEFLKSKADPFLFGELLPDMLTLIYGKMKRINGFYAARQAFSTSYGYWPSLIDAIKSRIYDKEYTKFKNCLANNLVKFGFSKNKSLQIIDSYMKMYLKTTIQEHLMGRVNLVLKYLPSFMEAVVRLIHIKYLFSKRSSGKDGSLDNYSSKYFKDLDRIRQTVLKHNI